MVDVLRKAAFSHPTSLAAAYEITAAASDQAGARWQRFPTPSFVSQTPHDRERFGSESNKLALDQPIYAGGRIDAGIDFADARHSSANLRHQAVAQDVATKLMSLWFEQRRHLSRQQVLEEGVAAHQKLKMQIERRVAEGVSPEADLTLVVARLSQMRSDLALSRSAARTAHAQLQQFAREYLPAFESEAFSHEAGAKPVSLPLPEWRSLAIARDPGLARLEAESEAAAAEIRVKEGLLFPTLSLRVENELSGPYQGTKAMLQVSVQPGAGFSALSAINAARARRDAALEARRNAQLELEQALDIDFADYASAQDRLEVANVLLRSTQDVADSYARQFVAGRKNWLDVLNAVREAISARLSIHDALAQQGQSWWRLRLRALGLAG